MAVWIFDYASAKGAFTEAALSPPSRNEAKPNQAKPVDRVVPDSEVWFVQALLVV